MLLFKRTAIGIYEMSIETFSSKDLIVVSYGVVGGKKVSNYVQGVKKLNSIIAKKRREGYKTLEDLNCDSISLNYAEIDFLLPEYNTDVDNYFKSMKCQPFVPNKFNYGSFERSAKAQPKINGNRGTISWGIIKNGLFSEEGSILKSHEGHVLEINHLREAFDKIFAKVSKSLVFDGEFYVRNEPVTSISGACRNPRNPIHSRLNYHCFDLAIPDVPQIDRLDMKHSIFKSFVKPGFVAKQLHPSEHSKFDDTLIVDVVDIDVHTDDESSDYRNLCLDEGYEGAVIRDPEAIYKFGSRPMTMMKLKRFKRGFFEVIDVKLFGFENNNTNNVGKGCVFILRNDLNNDLFESNATGTVEEKLKLYSNRANLIGTKVPVKYGERTANGLPFHSNVIINV
jgi:hypothetical protein